MKRIFVLFVFLAACGPLYAQTDNTPIIPERQTVIVDCFTSVPHVTLGMYQYARQVVFEGLAQKRINVINAEADGHGRADIVYPSFPFARANQGRPFDINRAIQLMNEYDYARYYLTAYISRYGSRPVEHKSKDKDGKEVIKTDFTADVELEVYLFDAETQETMGPVTWRYSYSGGHDPEYAERYAVSNLSGRARSFVEDNFPFKCLVIALGEYNKRGKLQDLYLSCGSDMDVSRGDVFYVYTVSKVGRVETARKIGKVKAREITGRESCRCTVSNGENEIDAAFKAGEILVAISDRDSFF